MKGKGTHQTKGKVLVNAADQHFKKGTGRMGSKWNDFVNMVNRES